MIDAGLTLSLGPLSVPVWGVVLISSYLLGLLAVRLGMRRDREVRNEVADRLSTAMLIAFVVWKLAPVLTNPSIVVRSPLYLVYATGGWFGMLLGAVAGVAYAGVATRTWWRSDDRSRRLRGVVLFLGAMALTGVAGGVIVSFVSAGESPKRVAGPDGTKIEATTGSAADVGRRGAEAPGFTLVDLKGNQVSLSGLRGKTVVLNFWASWCPPCRAEIPVLVRFDERLDPDRVVMLSINQTSSERTLEALERFVSDEGITYPVLLDGDGAVFLRYGVRGIPTTFVIGPDGSLIARHAGVVTRDWLRRYD